MSIFNITIFNCSLRNVGIEWCKYDIECGIIKCSKTLICEEKYKMNLLFDK